MNQTMGSFVSVFPQSDVDSALDEWWEAEAEDAELPPEPTGTVDVMNPLMEIDSHRAVRALITIEEVLNVGHIPESIIKPGGYADFEEMKADLMPKLEAYYDKKKKGKVNA